MGFDLTVCAVCYLIAGCAWGCLGFVLFACCLLYFEFVVDDLFGVD